MAHFCRLPSLQAVPAFNIPLGETWEVGLWGIDQNTGSLRPTSSDTNIAIAIPPLFPASAGVLKFAVTAAGMGGCDLNGVNGQGRSWAFAKVAVTSPTVPTAGGAGDDLLDAGPDYRVYPNYVDNNIKSGSYDIDAATMLITYQDGTTFDLPYRSALANIMATKGGPNGPGSTLRLSGFMINGKSKKIHPLQYTEATAPNIAAMVLETEEVMQNNKSLMQISSKFLDLVAVYAAAASAMKGAKPTWKAVPRGAAGSGSGGGFNQIPYGQTAESLGRSIGARAAEGAKTGGLLGQAGASWINRIIVAVRALKLSPRDSADVIESATKAAGYGYGPRGVIEGGTIVVTSARVGPGQFIIAVRPDGSVIRGVATLAIDVGQLPPVTQVTNVVLSP